MEGLETYWLGTGSDVDGSLPAGCGFFARSCSAMGVVGFVVVSGLVDMILGDDAPLKKVSSLSH